MLMVRQAQGTGLSMSLFLSCVCWYVLAELFCYRGMGFVGSNGLLSVGCHSSLN
jgi:hypothetical protein